MTFVAPDPDPTYEPLFVAANGVYNTTDSQLLAITTPAAAGGTDGVGDFLMFAAGSGTSNGGWTLGNFTGLTVGGEQGNMQSRVFWRVATGSEASSYQASLNYSSNYRRVGALCRWRRNNSDSPIRTQDMVKTVDGATGTLCPTPTDLSSSIQPDDLVIRVFMASETSASSSSSNDQTITNTALTSAGWTVRSTGTNETTSDDACCLTIADKVGATDRPVPTTNKTSNWIVYTIVLKGVGAPPQQLGAWFMAA